MANLFETIEVKPVEDQLTVNINKDGWDMTTVDNFTHISAEPPFAEAELTDIRERARTGGELAGMGLSRLAGLEIFEDPESGITLTLEGKLDMSKIKFGLAITEAVMSLRGLDAAAVKVDSSEVTHIIRRKNEEDEGNIQIVEKDEHHVVLRSPATGSLYGVALNRSADEEIPEITELEELEG